MSGLDDLTNLPSRNDFLRQLNEEIVACGSSGQPLCLLLVDLDYLKAINDHYGHLAGDEALRTVANILRTRLRTDQRRGNSRGVSAERRNSTSATQTKDTAGRYGGDEFVVLVPNTGLREGLLVAERLRAVTAASGVISGGHDDAQPVRLSLSLSIGVAIYPQDGSEVQTLFAAADRGAYAAKAAGRNAVRHAPAIQNAQQPVPIAIRSGRLIGRQTELARLRSLLEEACRGRGGIATIEGDAGIGKSRLAAELVGVARLLGAHVWQVRCHQVELASPYASFLEALSPIIEAITDETLREAAGEWAGEIGRLLPAMRRRLPDATPLPTLPPDEDRMRLQEALCAFIIGLARTPLLLVIDDMHWLDEASTRLLYRLTRQLDHAPLLLVGTIRSSDLAVNATLTQALASLARERLLRERIVVGRLNAEEAQALLHTAVGLGWEADSLQERLVTETVGNPLFLLETLRLLVDQGQLRQEGGQLRPDPVLYAAHALPLAPTVRAVIEARLAGLGSTERDLLAVAAVLGRSFQLEEIHDAAGYSHDGSLAALDHLEQRALVAPIQTHHFTVYEFVHPQIRDVAYGELSHARRRLFHRRIARILSDRQAPPGEIADHYGQAGEPENAYLLYIRAAEAAAVLHANEEAIVAYERALLAAESLPNQALQPPPTTLHERLGDLRALAGRWDAAAEAYAAARIPLRGLDAEGDPWQLAAARAELWRKEGDTHDRRGDYIRALAAFDAADAEGTGEPATARRPASLPARAAAGDPNWAWVLAPRAARQRSSTHPLTLQAAIAVSRGLTHHHCGDYRAATAAALHALELIVGNDGHELGSADATNDRHVIAQAHTLLGSVAAGHGDYARAEDHYRRALVIRERIGDHHGIAASCDYLGTMASQRGDYTLAVDLHRRALAIRERLGDHHGGGRSSAYLGTIAWRLGDYTHAAAALAHASVVHDRLGDHYGKILTQSMLTYLARDIADHTQARAHARRARHAAGRHHDGPGKAIAYLATVGSIQHSPSERAQRIAEAAINRIDTLAARHGLHRTAQYATLYRAELHLSRGNPNAARVLAAPVAVLAQDARQRPLQAYAERILGHIAYALGDYNAALTHHRIAQDLYTACNVVVEAARGASIVAHVLCQHEPASVDEIQRLRTYARRIFTERNLIADIVQLDQSNSRSQNLLTSSKPYPRKRMSTILLVEDNEMNRDMLSRRLERKGFHVVMAVDGSQGIAMVNTEQPDLILMDMSLPVLDGWEATRRLKSDPETRHIPIIALTAHAMSGDREKAIDAGCDDYDTKPIEFPRLLEKIRVLLDAPAAP